MKKLLLLCLTLLLSGCIGRIAALQTDCGGVTATLSAYHSCIKDHFESSKYDMTKDERSASNKIEITETDTLVIELENQIDGIVKSTKKGNDQKGIEEIKELINTYTQREQVRDQQAAAASAAFLTGAAILATCARDDYNCSNLGGYDTPLMCSQCPSCSPVCTIGKACGNTCIEATDTCHVGRGTACNTNYRSYP